MFPWNMFPFNEKQNEMNPFGFGGSNSNIDEYVQKMLSQVFSQDGNGPFSQNFMKPLLDQIQQAMPPSFQGQNNQSNDIQMFETFEYIIIRITIKDEDWLDKLKLYHTTNQVFLENTTDPSKQQTITLPAIVQKKGATAVYKEGIIELTLRKKTDMQFTEVDVTKR